MMRTLPVVTLALAATAFAAIALVQTAAAQNPAPTCPAPPRTRVVRFMHDLPAEVRSALLAKTPDIVDSNQPFDATDVVMHGAHFNRFAFAWNGPDGRWIVATEHGGIAYDNPVYTLVAPSAPQTGLQFAVYPASIVSTIISRPKTLCEDAERAFQSKLPSLPPAKPKSVTKG